jgi:sensor histidine kinase YesM
MILHDIIFSNKQPERLLRHLAFWIAQSLFWVFWVSFLFYRTWDWVLWGFRIHGYFILEIAYTYLITYYLAPKFLDTKRYTKFALTVSLLTLITYPLFVAIQFVVHGLIRSPSDQQLLYAYFSTMKFIISGPPVICGLFLTAKMLKNYYLKMKEKATIIKESANAEMQLLKAQIHPHFLFNTLNNIYSFNLDKSPVAADLVLKLSHTLKYMINDCEAPLVPLVKEIKMLQDYIGLEKVRYGPRLVMTAEINGDTENRLVAPLLLIPFLENSFKHGASKVLDHPWITMNIRVEDHRMYFEISNSKPVQQTAINGKNGIGLSNVRKRLSLLYPDEHSLELTEDSAFYNVKLNVPLHKTEVPKETDNLKINPEKNTLTDPGIY